MSDEIEASARPRASRFKEHTNTNSSIRPPPDERWKDLGIEELLDQFNEENAAPPLSRKTTSDSAAARAADGPLNKRTSSESRALRTQEVQSAARSPRFFGAPSVITQTASSPAAPTAPAPAASEGTFGRLQRAVASVFGGVLGKRRIASVDIEKEKEKKVLDDRKKAADAAYQEAKELGTLPTPKVFVKQGAINKSHKGVADAPTPDRASRTHKLPRMPSKRDLQKQDRLRKRVSELRTKLDSAQKELQSILHVDQLPPVPALPAVLPPTPTASQSEHDNDTPPHRVVDLASTVSPAVSPLPALAPAAVAPVAPPVAEPEKPVRKVTKKRKAVTEDEDQEDSKPVIADSDGDIDMALSPEKEESAASKRTAKRVKASPRKNPRKQPSDPRLQKKKSKTVLKKEEPVTVTPDGVSVPLVPEVPRGVKGKKAEVRIEITEATGVVKNDDGYGGFGDEIF